MSTEVKEQVEQVEKVDVRKSILADSKKDSEEYVKSYDVGRGSE